MIQMRLRIHRVVVTSRCVHNTLCGKEIVSANVRVRRCVCVWSILHLLSQNSTPAMLYGLALISFSSCEAFKKNRTLFCSSGSRQPSQPDASRNDRSRARRERERKRRVRRDGTHAGELGVRQRIERAHDVLLRGVQERDEKRSHLPELLLQFRSRESLVLLHMNSAHTHRPRPHEQAREKASEQTSQCAPQLEEEEETSKMSGKVPL
jgi:hypothetical protein